MRIFFDARQKIDNELLNYINTKLEFYNKLTEDKVNLMFKQLWFNGLYDSKVRGITPTKQKAETLCRIFIK